MTAQWVALALSSENILLLFLAVLDNMASLATELAVVLLLLPGPLGCCMCLSYLLACDCHLEAFLEACNCSQEPFAL
jgi:hypothetical protein